MTKTEARAQAKAMRKNLDLHAIGAAMTQQLFALPAWRQAGTVFCFVSMRDEPDTTAILQQALVSGKRLCVPRCLPGNDGRMELVEITSLNDLQPGRYGILEPCGGRTIAAAAARLLNTRLPLDKAPSAKTLAAAMRASGIFLEADLARAAAPLSNLRPASSWRSPNCTWPEPSLMGKSPRRKRRDWRYWNVLQFL